MAPRAQVELTNTQKVLSGVVTALFITVITGGYMTVQGLRDGLRDVTAGMTRLEDRISVVGADRYTATQAASAHALLAKDIDAVRLLAAQANDGVARLQERERRPDRPTRTR